MRLNVFAFALTSGILWGAGLFLAALWLMIMEGQSTEPFFLSRIYRGYSITVPGAFLGLLWGLFDGVICGGIFAWLYNRLTGEEE
jgi:hypothetical protein